MPDHAHRQQNRMTRHARVEVGGYVVQIERPECEGIHPGSTPDDRTVGGKRLLRRTRLQTQFFRQMRRYRHQSEAGFEQ